MCVYACISIHNINIYCTPRYYLRIRTLPQNKHNTKIEEEQNILPLCKHLSGNIPQFPSAINPIPHLFARWFLYISGRGDFKFTLQEIGCSWWSMLHLGSDFTHQPSNHILFLLNLYLLLTSVLSEQMSGPKKETTATEQLPTRLLWLFDHSQKQFSSQNGSLLAGAESIPLSKHLHVLAKRPHCEDEVCLHGC